jgi:hypothetical protein
MLTFTNPINLESFIPFGESLFKLWYVFERITTFAVGVQFCSKTLFRISTWKFAHIKISIRLACIKKFGIFELGLSEIWRFQKSLLFHRYEKTMYDEKETIYQDKS